MAKDCDHHLQLDATWSMSRHFDDRLCSHAWWRRSSLWDETRLTDCSPLCVTYWTIDADPVRHASVLGSYT